MTGTAQTTSAPLTQGETLEFGAAVLQQLGRTIDPEKARYYIKHKRQLGEDLCRLGIHTMPEQPAFDTAEWEGFYEKHFSLKPDLSALHVPVKPGYTCRGVVVLPELGNNRIFDACTKAFKTWRYDKNLDTVRDIVQRPATAYVLWVRDDVEADADMANKSANDVENAGTNTMTLKERMLLELKFFEETGNHLDLQNVTLCTGSRYSGGRVPNAYWDSDEFSVDWDNPDSQCSYLRARVAVS